MRLEDINWENQRCCSGHVMEGYGTVSIVVLLGFSCSIEVQGSPSVASDVVATRISIHHRNDEWVHYIFHVVFVDKALSIGYLNRQNYLQKYLESS